MKTTLNVNADHAVAVVIRKAVATMTIAMLLSVTCCALAFWFQLASKPTAAPAILIEWDKSKGAGFRGLRPFLFAFFAESNTTCGLSVDTRKSHTCKPMSEPIEDDDEAVRENFYREAALRVLPLIYSATAHVMSAKNPEIGLAQVRFSLGIEDKSMRDIAAKLNVSVACISKGARAFVEDNNLPTPSCMKSDDACESYRTARSYRA